MDFIAAKLDAKKALERAEKTLANTLFMLEEANKNGMLATLGKYQQQAKRQREALARAQQVYDELNKAVTPSAQADLLAQEPAPSAPKRR